MQVLVIGSGGREHALAWKLLCCEQVTKVFVAPGNGGTATTPGMENVPLSATDIVGLLQFAQETQPVFTVVGPEAPLAAGLVDAFQANGLPCFGPTQAAAQLESSKAFCKDFLAKHGIATAEYATFSDQGAAKSYARTLGLPCVIKASGLAAGKGVFIAQSWEEVDTAVECILAEQRFGDAGQTVVVEAFLQGEELSFIAMVDGDTAIPWASSQDHKRRFDHDMGPNTGGMGAFSPSPLINDVLQEQIMADIIRPTVAGMKAAGTPFTGFLYAGLMIGPDGIPRVLEYNCRLGDPEAQPLLMRLGSNVFDLIQAALAGQLHQLPPLSWAKQTALAVVLVSGEYPESGPTGLPIDGLTTLPSTCTVFHAATQASANGWVTSGGRVLTLATLADNLAQARAALAPCLEQVRWPNRQYRKDIGARACNKVEVVE